MFDLQELAENWPRLHKYIKNNRIDLSIPAAKRELTCAIAWSDYKILLSFPLDSLIPVIPNRIYYLKWIKNTLNISDTATGLDIGTGNTAIYPLLGSKLFPNWKWFATEENKNSFEFASLNIIRNQLENVHLFHTSEYFPDNVLEKVDFVMTNPPFYGSEDELNHGNNRKFRSKKYTPGSNHELITQGGEYAFVLQIIQNSNRKQGIWYTCLFGKKQNFLKMIETLKMEKVESKTTVCHLGKTKRWIMAWRFLKE